MSEQDRVIVSNLENEFTGDTIVSLPDLAEGPILIDQTITVQEPSLVQDLPVVDDIQPSERMAQGYWKENSNIERELRSIIDSVGHFPTPMELRGMGKNSLAHAVTESGGFREWRQQLGFTITQKPPDYWTDTQNIDGELRKIVEKIGHFPSALEIVSSGSSTLVSAVTRNGGFNYWRERLGFERLPEKKESGYWNNESNIELEILRLIEEHHLSEIPSAEQLHSMGEASLSAAIIRNGGYSKWRQRFGSQTFGREIPWTVEEIEKQASEFIMSNGGLSQSLLSKEKRFDLRHAISEKYPGGMRGIKAKFGINQAQPEGYWSAEKALEEAKKFVGTYGRISRRLLLKKGAGGLMGAITKYYPGGFTALNSYLGIEEENFGKISPDQADELMRGLEEEI